MSKPLKSFYEATRYLGQYMGKDLPFLKDSSCMGLDRRRQLAILKWAQEIPEDLDNLSEKEIFDKVLIPLIEKLGLAEWPRDTVTDMAIRKGLITEGDIWDIDKDDNPP